MLVVRYAINPISCIILVGQSGVDSVRCIVRAQKYARYCWFAARLCTLSMWIAYVIVLVRDLDVNFSYVINLSGIRAWLVHFYCASEWICCALIALTLIVHLFHANAKLWMYLCNNMQWRGRHAQRADLCTIFAGLACTTCKHNMCKKLFARG